MKHIALILIIFFCNTFIYSQKTIHDFGFTRNLNIPVQDTAAVNYKNAWTGGMSSCQFSSIDLNFDGIKDLFIYDRASSKILTFINNGIMGSADYSFAPQYIERFPKIHDWAQLVDYNGDGKEDIFTYGIGAIAVYKNISNIADGLKFSLITPSIYSKQGPSYTNILVTQVDYPAIADIDNDGDLDILTFFGLLDTNNHQYIRYHRNMSKELYGNSDSLKYVLEEDCWGNFAESSTDNTIDINLICPYKNGKNKFLETTDDIKHTGSTMLAIDIDGDNDKDFIVGDISYPTLISLVNGGTPDSANMIAKDTIFPYYDQPVHFFSFPVACYLDINNDNKKDMLVSPFDNSSTSSENFNSVWMYKNTGTTSAPYLHLEKKNFLQDEMIDVGAGAYPVLYDYDGDNLLDIFIGNYGYYDSSYFSLGYLQNILTSQIALYKNIGTNSNPQFKLITRNFANLRAKHLLAIYPTFGDIDGDGDADMIIGDSKGNLYRYENTAGNGNPMNMIFHDSIPINVGNAGRPGFSTPQLVDLDNDSLIDLVIGEKNGNLNFYKNTGTKFNPVFTFVTDSFGHIDIIDHAWSNYGYSVPCFFKDSFGKYKLFVGSESGRIFYYKNIDDNLNGHFTLFDKKLLNIYEGTRSGVAVGNLNNDAYLDMIVGNMSGGLSYFAGSTPLIGITKALPITPFDVVLYPNPADNSITIDLSNIVYSDSIIIRIFDIVGNTLFTREQKNNNHLTVDVKHLSNGFYFCAISFMGKNKQSYYTVNKKFIVLH